MHLDLLSIPQSGGILMFYETEREKVVLCVFFSSHFLSIGPIKKKNGVQTISTVVSYYYY